MRAIDISKRLILLFQKLPEAKITHKLAIEEGYEDELAILKEIQKLTVLAAETEKTEKGFFNSAINDGVIMQAEMKRYQIRDNGALMNHWNLRRNNGYSLTEGDIRVGVGKDKKIPENAIYPDISGIIDATASKKAFNKYNPDDQQAQKEAFISILKETKEQGAPLAEGNNNINIFQLGIRDDLALLYMSAVKTVYPEKNIVLTGINHDGRAVNFASETLSSHFKNPSDLILGEGKITKYLSGELYMPDHEDASKEIRIDKSDLVISSYYAHSYIMNKELPEILQRLMKPQSLSIVISNEYNTVTPVKDDKFGVNGTTSLGHVFRPDDPAYDPNQKSSVSKWFEDAGYSPVSFTAASRTEFPRTKRFWDEMIINKNTGDYTYPVKDEYADDEAFLFFLNHAPVAAMSPQERGVCLNAMRVAIENNDGNVDFKTGFNVISSTNSSDKFKQAVETSATAVARGYSQFKCG